MAKIVRYGVSDTSYADNNSSRELVNPYLIVQDANHRFVSDTDIAKWNNGLVSGSVSGSIGYQFQPLEYTLTSDLSQTFTHGLNLRLTPQILDSNGNQILTQIVSTKNSVQVLTNQPLTGSKLILNL